MHYYLWHSNRLHIQCYLDWLDQEEKQTAQSQNKAASPVVESEESKAKRKEEIKQRRAEAKSRAAQSTASGDEAKMEAKPSPNAVIDARSFMHFQMVLRTLTLFLCR